MNRDMLRSAIPINLELFEGMYCSVHVASADRQLHLRDVCAVTRTGDVTSDPTTGVDDEQFLECHVLMSKCPTKSLHLYCMYVSCPV